jgi:sugar phosphate isomerase/epimerase
LKTLGVQLVSVRDALNTDPEPVIAALSQIGFTEVEVWFPPTNAPDVKSVRAALDRHGMAAPSRHWVSRDLSHENLDRMLTECEALGSQSLVVTSLPVEQRGKLDSYKRAAEWFNEVGKAAHNRGVQFAFHSEPFDFPPLDGLVPFDYLIDHTDPTRVKFQLDTANITKGGQRPLDYLTRLGNRVVSLHLKEVTANGEAADLGNGVVPFAEILQRATALGMKHYFVEDERRDQGYGHVGRAFSFVMSLEF